MSYELFLLKLSDLSAKPINQQAKSITWSFTWHQTLEIDKLIEFHAIELMKLKKLPDIECTTLNGLLLNPKDKHPHMANVCLFGC